VDVTAALVWRPGRDAVSHEVYFGTDAAAPALAGTVNTAGYDPGAMNLATTYYWKVDEILEAESWAGPVWSFSTQEYLIVDDFESYDDEENRIYDTWLDGWVNETGSTVGHLDAPFAEQSIVHGGNQSMPLFYDNTAVATSEADLELTQDWTVSGIKSLSLYVCGDADNSGGQVYAAINNTKIVADGATVDVTDPTWQLWNIDLAAVGNLSDVRSLTIGIEGAGTKGVVYIDDIELHP